MSKTEPQPDPDAEKSCPECDAPWSEVTDVKSHLAAVGGYHHKDGFRECLQCGAEWKHGVPIGESGVEPPECPVCDDLLLAHKYPSVDADGDRWERLEMKCPTCYYWTRDFKRYLSRLPNGQEAFGYPSITGEVNNE